VTLLILVVLGTTKALVVGELRGWNASCSSPESFCAGWASPDSSSSSAMVNPLLLLAPTPFGEPAEPTRELKSLRLCLRWCTAAALVPPFDWGRAGGGGVEFIVLGARGGETADVGLKAAYEMEAALRTWLAPGGGGVERADEGDTGGELLEVLAGETTSF